MFSKGFLKTISVCSLFFLSVLCGVNLAGCGRKGPPLPPLVRLPGAIVDLSAKRLGDEVDLQFTVPVANADGSRPADLDRVEIYAHTGRLPAPADFLKYGALIASIAVKNPASVGASQIPGLEEGARALAKETITPAEMEAGKMPVVRAARTRTTAPVVEPTYETPDTVNAPLPPFRYYVAVGVSRRNQRGGFSAQLPVPLLPPFPAPGALAVKYTQDSMVFEWTPLPRGADIFVPWAVYNIYDVTDPVAPDVAGAPDILRSPADAERQAPVGQAGVQVATASAPPAPPPLKAPLNPTPAILGTFTAPQVQFGVRRCYVLRAVRMAGLVSLESEGSPPICLAPVDTFPPEAPKQLLAGVSDNSVSLIWDPNTDKDLAGYLVLRGETPGETLTPLTPEPIRDTTFRDTTVKPGVSYDYVVVAIDNAPVPNSSEYSNRVTQVVP